MMKPEVKKALYAEVTAGIIEQMEQGVAVWQQPWMMSARPMNGHTERPYNGWNRLYLGWMQSGFGSDDPRWFTMNNVKEIGAKVRKGSKSTIVVFNAPAMKEEYDESGLLVDTKVWWNVKYYRVFHASQIDGLPEYEAESNPEVEGDDCDVSPFIDWCEANVSLSHGGDVACYVPLFDEIRMPERDTFKKDSWYAQTLAHEMIHATGAESRLNRLEKGGFGTDTYAKEELVAEFGAAMLCGSIGVAADMEQSAAYLKGWASKCKDDPGLLISAANQAEKAVDFITEDVYAIV